MQDARVVEISGDRPVSSPDASSETATTTATDATTTPQVSLAAPVQKFFDIEPQQPLPNPPEVVKAVYATSWSGGSTAKMNYLVGLINETELNAIVIDIKDFSGYVAYATDLELPKTYHAVELRIPKINSLLKRLHDEGIYVIARISVFQDQRLAIARPDLALTSSSTGAVWRDRKGLTWIDAAAKEAWDYNIAIAREALERGFDEVNLDYIRFAADGNLDDIVYPLWDGKTLKAKIMKDFWEYTRRELIGETISADLFGLTTVDAGDLGIGQRLENAFPYFDDIAPMVYPSHYYPGSFGFANPAEHPYEVVFQSLTRAIERVKNYEVRSKSDAGTTTPITNFQLPIPQLRPWLQDFDLGADYNAEMVKKQIQAVYDAASTTPEFLSGWMLWNPSNVYTRDALELEP